jgi:hypothetical protein
MFTRSLFQTYDMIDADMYAVRIVAMANICVCSFLENKIIFENQQL